MIDLPNHTSPDKNRTFVARYGATILRGGIASIPAALYRYQGALQLTVQQVWFISAILSYKWGADLPYPSLKKMATDCNVAEKQLHKYKNELVEKSLLEIK